MKFWFLRIGSLVSGLQMGLGEIARSEVALTEIVAANSGGLADQDGDDSDWIEITNLGPVPIDLSEWFLSDDCGNPEKWEFPSVILSGEERLVVFASGKDRRDPSEPHTNFRLNRQGEYLALFNGEGEREVALDPFPPIPEGLSWGRDEASGSMRFFSNPTPGAPNRDSPDAGPILVEATSGPMALQVGDDVPVSVRLSGDLALVAEVLLLYEVMYQGERKIQLRDDGLAPDDEVEGDGVFSGRIRSRNVFGPVFEAGEMVRWAFLARDVSARETRLPAWEEGQETARYFGGLVEDPTVTSSLPILHWFVEDPEAARTTRGTRASAFFNGSFYDHFFVRRRGQFGAINWPKAKFKLDFNPGDHFRYDPGRRRVEELNLQPHYNDPSYLREPLGFRFFREAGTPASDTRHWHVRQNGGYFGLFSLVEQVDEDFLRQNGKSPEGAMYKANGFPSTLAAVVSPSLYQKETRKEEPYDDLEAFVRGINGLNGVDRSRFVHDHVNIAAMINEMACQTILYNADRLTKNYYMYRDAETGLWERFPWDLDGAFSNSSSLKTENYASPLYGDSDHTQAPGQKIYQNFLLDAILDDRRMRAMYLRRLRTLIDRFMSRERGYFDQQFDLEADRLAIEANLDATRWGLGDFARAVREIKDVMLPSRYDVLLGTYGPGAGLIPEAATEQSAPVFGLLEATPDDPESEFFTLRNQGREDLDLSSWRIAGAVDYQFPAGTVLPRKGTILQPDYGVLYLVKSVQAFLGRSTGPSGNQGHLFSGNYSGQLSSRGGILRLLDSEGQQMAELAFAGSPSPAMDGLRISEIHYHPASASREERQAGLGRDDFEFLEITNTGSVRLGLNGIRFTAGIQWTLEGEDFLSPGESGVLVRNEQAFRVRYGDDVRVIGAFEGRLRNSGETIEYRDALGETIGRVTYDDDWFPRTDGEGRSLEASDLNRAFDDWASSDAWLASSAEGGSPGQWIPGDGIRYSDWAASQFSAEEMADEGISGPNGTAREGEVTNLLRYAFGWERKTPVGSTSALRFESNGGLRHPLNPLALDLEFQLEVSGDVENWSVVGWDYLDEAGFRTWKVDNRQPLGAYRVKVILTE
ncbi:MAG: CotH kinase family protein [Verrucomicrobiota bacterium]